MVALEGDPTEGLTAAVFRNRSTGATHICPLRHLFLFIGADPNAAWLQNCAAVDDKGFVLTGLACPDGASARRRAALPLETSVPGVFAIGDVRAGSTKRVAAAVGEGAAVVAQIHTALALQPERHLTSLRQSASAKYRRPRDAAAATTPRDFNPASACRA